MSGKENCYDNAPIESWFDSLQVEYVDGIKYKSRNEDRNCLIDNIMVLYNHQRVHSYLGYLNPRA